FVDRSGTVTPYSGVDYPVSELAKSEIRSADQALAAMAAQVPPEAPWTASQAGEWDAQSAGIWIRDNVQDPTARAVLLRNVTTLVVNHPSAVSLLNLLFLMKSAANLPPTSPAAAGSEVFRIVGGTQQVPLAIAARL